ncbi:hypothetical protein OPV22_021092 [Ensete ventricosum]|uniref:Uncharacterized protein n=1 Tax=Ensete ventricosum TaxID=4639 RepID=A0AAV8PAR9_ENSVE|nr:hypothetical protein OPV22_021092 [Ensete ventricosum]
MSSLLARGCRSSTLKSTTSAALPSVGDYARGRRYSAEKKDEPQGVVEKATSTAEEFLRRAKEKSEAVGESAKEVVEDAKEAVVGESQERKQRFKEKVEKGNYDNIRRD